MEKAFVRDVREKDRVRERKMLIGRFPSINLEQMIKWQGKYSTFQKGEKFSNLNLLFGDTFNVKKRKQLKFISLR